MRLVTLGGLLVGDDGLLAHGRDDSDNEILALVELGLDLVSDLTLGKRDIVLGGTVGGEERQETIINVDELELLSLDVGDLHVVGGGGQILKLLVGEDIGGDKVDLGVTVLTSLGGGHVNDLAGSALDHDVTVLSQSGALDGVGLGSTGVNGIKGVLRLVYDRSVHRLCNGSDRMMWPVRLSKPPPV